jgi:hypothetical protein
MTGNPADTVDRLAKLKIGVLAVEFLPCGDFEFTSMDPTSGTYWAERWELFKHTYVVAGWGWTRAVTKVREARCAR